MPYSWLVPFLTQNFPWAPHSSGLRVSSLPSRCWMLSLLQKQEALSGSHLPASHTFPRSPSPPVPEQGTDQLWPRHKIHWVPLELWGLSSWAAGQLLQTFFPKKWKKFNILVKKRKAIRRKHSTEACCPWSKKLPWVVHMLPAGWAFGLD